MAHEQLLTNDELLSTTRAVRKRLDFDRPVSLDAGSWRCRRRPAQIWQFVFVTDADKRRRIGIPPGLRHYRDMPVAIHKLHQGSGDVTASQTRSAASADYLADNMGQAPVLMIPCIAGRTDNPEGAMAFAQTAVLGSVIPAAWNFMWPPGHAASAPPGLVMHEREVADLLGIPSDFMQVALMPIDLHQGHELQARLPPAHRQRMHSQGAVTALAAVAASSDGPFTGGGGAAAPRRRCGCASWRRICHTDVAVKEQSVQLPLPMVLGHEGAGIVEAVGSSVRHLRVGDPVVLAGDSCGECRRFGSDEFVERNLTGLSPGWVQR